MKKILTILCLLLSLITTAQQKISDFPLYTGSGDSATTIVVLGTSNRKMYGVDLAKAALALRLKYSDTAAMFAAHPGGIFDTTGKFIGYQNAINGRLKITDTSAMLQAYQNGLNGRPLSGLVMKYTDTTSVLAAYQIAINLRLKIADTSAMLTAYQNGLNNRPLNSAAMKYTDTASVLLAYQNGLNAKVKYTDTSGMLLPYGTALNARVRYSDTSAMQANYRSTLNGHTASIATNAANILSKVNISDTSAMLSAYRAGKVNVTDTSAMLAAYRTGKVNVSDTAAMLTAYKNGLNAKVNVSDTSSMLTNYRNTLNSHTAGIATNTSSILLKVNIADTSAMLTAYRNGINTNTSAKLSKGITGTRGLLIGDSETDTAYGQYRLDTLMLNGTDTTNSFTIKNQARFGNTIYQQDSTWLADPNKATYDWIIVMIGLNDVWNYATENAVTALGRYQTLINDINAGKKAGAPILIAAMQPVGYVQIYGSTQGALAYAKWQAMNDAMMGKGANAITGVDYRFEDHSWLLNDGTGALAPLYDNGDHIHDNNYGRQQVANIFRQQLNKAGFFSNRFLRQTSEFWNYSSAGSNILVPKTPQLSIGTASTGSIALGATTALSKFYLVNNSSASGHIDFWSTGTSTAASSITSTFAFTPTYNESGTASNNVLFLSPFYQANGSGTHYLIRAGTNTASNAAGTHTDKFTVDNSGNVAITGGFTGVGYTGSGAFTNTYSSASANNINMWLKGTSTAASGLSSQFALTPTWNESGSAGHNALFISPFSQAAGSGAKYLIRAGTNTASNAAGVHTDKFTVDESGNVITVGTVNGASATEMGYLSGVTSSIQTQLGARVLYTDTSAMFAAYRNAINGNTANIATNTSSIALKVNISDTSAMLLNYRNTLNSHTASIATNATNIGLKVNISDTAAMLLPYRNIINTNTSNIALKVNYTDTSSMLAAYRNALNAKPAISLTTTGTSGAATYNSSTGALNIPQYTGGGGAAFDTTTVYAKIKSDSSTLSTATNLKLNKTDTANMLAAYRIDSVTKYFMRSLENVQHWVQASTSNSTVFAGSGMQFLNLGGTATARSISSGIFTQYARVGVVATSAAGAVVGYKNNYNNAWFGNGAGMGGFDFSTTFGNSSVTATDAVRGYVIMTTTTGTITTEPSVGVNFFGFAYSSGGTNWKVFYNDGSGTADSIDLGANFPTLTTSSAMYKFQLSAPGNQQKFYYQITNLSTGAVANGSVTTNIPSATTFFGYQFQLNSAAVTGAPAMDLVNVYFAPRYGLTGNVGNILNY